MGPLGPHLHQLFNADLDCFGSVLDVGVPDLVGSHPSHLQLVVLHDVDCHQTPVVGVGLVVAPRIVHVALDNVQNLANQNDRCVSLLPVGVEGSVAEGFQEQISMAQAVVADKHFFYQHG